MLNNFSFRPLRANDIALLHEWLHRPHIREWWGDAGNYLQVAADYLPICASDATTRGYIALRNSEPAGFIQLYDVMASDHGWWDEETDPGARGIDQFLAHEEHLNRGMGRAMIEAFVATVFADPAVTKIQTDPSPANLRAIRCYQRAGFIAQQETITPDGAALLMVRTRG